MEPINSQIKKSYELEVIVVGKGINNHETFLASADGVEQSVLFDGQAYHVSPNQFYKKELNLFSKIKDKFRGVKQRYLIVFVKADQDAFPHFKMSKKSILPLITSQDLYNVEESSTARKYFNEMFSQVFGNKKLLFIIGIAVVGVIAFMIYTGKVKI